MIKITTVHICPHTVTGQGVMHLTHDVIGKLAGAVQDDIEWLALLAGTRSDDGLTIHVTDLVIPEQDRSYGACSLVHLEGIGPHIVGVVHSHHSMGAFFSNTDDTKLNTRFPSSIVIAQTRSNSSNPELLLGFNYKAEGRAPLPCGAIGVVQYSVLPSPAIKQWPETFQAGYSKPNTNVTLRYCPLVERKDGTLYETCKTKCGIEKIEANQSIFGTDSVELMKEINNKTRRRTTHVVPGAYKGPQSWPVNFSDRERFLGSASEEFLRHWSAYGGD